MTGMDDATNPIFPLDLIDALTAISSPEAWRRHQIEAIPLDDRHPILPPNHPLIRREP